MSNDITRYTRYYKYLVDRISDQQPSERKSLRQLLDEENPFVKLRDGSMHMFSRSDVKLLFELLSDYLRDKPLIPIVIGKISGTSLYKILNCNRDYTQLLIELVEKRFIEKESIELDECLIRYEAVKKMLKELRSLIILTIIQDSYIGWDVSSEERVS